MLMMAVVLAYSLVQWADIMDALAMNVKLLCI